MRCVGLLGPKNIAFRISRLYLSVCLSICLSICLSVCLSFQDRGFRLFLYCIDDGILKYVYHTSIYISFEFVNVGSDWTERDDIERERKLKRCRSQRTGAGLV